MHKDGEYIIFDSEDKGLLPTLPDHVPTAKLFDCISMIDDACRARTEQANMLSMSPLNTVRGQSSAVRAQAGRLDRLRSKLEGFFWISLDLE